jgi:hypothetical protein
MLRDTANILETKGFTEGSSRDPGSYVVERAFADG